MKNEKNKAQGREEKEKYLFKHVFGNLMMRENRLYRGALRSDSGNAAAAVLML